MLKLCVLVLAVFIAETFSQITTHPVFTHPQLSSESVRIARDVGVPEANSPSTEEKQPPPNIFPPHKNDVKLNNDRRIGNSKIVELDENADSIKTGLKHRVARQSFLSGRRGYPGGRGGGRGGRGGRGGFNQYRMQGRGRGYPMMYGGIW